MQMFFFLTQTRCLLENFLSDKGFFAALREHTFVIVEWAEVSKMIEVFWAKLNCKISNLFRQFLLALRLSARKSEIKNKLMISTGICGRIYTCLKIFISLSFLKVIKILVTIDFNFIFLDCFRAFLSSVFLIFWRHLAMVADIFTMLPPSIKKLSTALNII